MELVDFIKNQGRRQLRNERVFPDLYDPLNDADDKMCIELHRFDRQSIIHLVI